MAEAPASSTSDKPPIQKLGLGLLIPDTLPFDPTTTDQGVEIQHSGSSQNTSEPVNDSPPHVPAKRVMEEIATSSEEAELGISIEKQLLQLTIFLAEIEAASRRLEALDAEEERDSVETLKTQNLDEEKNGKDMERVEEENEGDEEGYGSKMVKRYHLDEEKNKNDAESVVEENENWGNVDESEVGGQEVAKLARQNNSINRRKISYPMRPDVEDCAYYMKFWSCKFGSNCKFNHPPSKKYQGVKERANHREENRLSLSTTQSTAMASLFRDRALGLSKRDSFSFSSSSAAATASPSSATSRFNSAANYAALTPLPSPFGDLTPTLSDSDIRSSAYEIFLSANRSSTSKPLTYTPNSNNSNSPNHSSTNGNSNANLQRSLTSAAASKMKKALGMRSGSSKKTLDSHNSIAGGKMKKPVTIGELVRVQMKVSEAVDSRIRRGLLRISAGQVGRRSELIVLPLELLQQFKASDFTDQQEYEAWQKRNLRMLEAGLLLHPHTPLEKANTSSQRLRQVINAALDRPIETGRNNESMQVLRTTVMALASRTSDGAPFECHWADGFPLNLRLYESLLEACFDINDETSFVEEVDELMELIKKTWGILSMNQTLHNLCFTWVLFNRYVATGQVEIDLLRAADSQLAEVAKDAKVSKDSIYCTVLSSTLTAMLGWAEKRLLAYHETFDSGNIDLMESIVSIGVLAAKILVEDISKEYRRRRKNEVDVALSRIDTYIRSSLRTAFAQRMEKADSSRRAARNQPNPLPVLAILAKDVGELAIKEKDTFSPILKIWHPFAAGVAVATLHACFGNELKQYISGITELTPDAVQILRAADKLEKDLVQIAVEDSVDSDDGGKAIIREMPPYEAEGVIANMVKLWIKIRIDRLKEWVDRNLEIEVWNPRANQEGCAPSAVEVLRIVDETLEAFFLLPIPMHPALLPDLVTGLDKCLQYYATKAKSGCGSRNIYIPTMPALTRCTTGTKFHWKKKEKAVTSQRRNPQVATVNGDSSSNTVLQLCVRINTLHKIRMEFEVLEKRIMTLLRNSESAHVEDFSNGLGKTFELTPATCIEAVQQLSEGVAYKIVFHDLSHVLWDYLYIGDPSASRIEPFLQELEKNLTIVADTVHERVRTRIIADVMRASFDGFFLVLLAGGPTRAFSKQESQMIEDDFKSLKDLFWANGDGLPDDVIDKFSSTARGVLPLLRTDTESLIERFRRLTLETYGSSAKSRLPLPPTSGQWDPNEPNTLLRVLCYRNDEAASKFLKKTYNLPKKL